VVKGGERGREKRRGGILMMILMMIYPLLSPGSIMMFFNK